ncbi:hypothetical protein HDK64DRAFT_40443 [Phyllosticta capitalensis]
MFCSTLRRRPSTEPIIPILKDRSGLNFQGKLRDTCLFLARSLHAEKNFEKYDLIIPSNRGNVLVLIVTPGSVEPERLATTVERVRRFATLKGGNDSAILFLLQPLGKTIPTYFLDGGVGRTVPVLPASRDPSPIEPYDRFKTALDANSISAPPILLAPSNQSVEPVLKAFIGGQQSTHPPSFAESFNTALDILPHCTAATEPLDRETIFCLTDLFPCLRDLAYSSTDDKEAQELLKGMNKIVGQQAVQDVIDFWREEWVAE